MYAAPETISNEAMISRPPPPMARPMGLNKIVIIFQSSYKQGQRKYLEIFCRSSFSKRISDAPFERNTGNQFVTPVATFVGKLINLWISMGSVDNWSDHEGNRQYTEYQKNTSAPGNNTRMLKYLSTRQYYIGQADYSRGGNHRENDRGRRTCTYMELNKKENHSLYLL